MIRDCLRKTFRILLLLVFLWAAYRSPEDITHFTLPGTDNKKLVPATRQKIQSLGVFLMLNRGCPFMPGFKYLLERYFVMSSIPATDVACLSMRALLARSKMLAAWSASPTISQKILAGRQMACIWVPFFVHRKVPRSESIDFSQEGSFSTIHLGILLSLCTVLGSVFNQIYWLWLMIVKPVNSYLVQKLIGICSLMRW